MKKTKWAEVYVFTVFCKVLSDHILPRVKNTHARVKKQDEKYGVKNTKWPEVCVFTVFCKVLSDHILPRVTNTHARVKNPDEKYGVKKYQVGGSLCFHCFWQGFV